MAKQRRFKCSKCDRKFSMAAHLARHMSTIHASKKVKAAKKRKRVAAKKRRPATAARAERGTGGGLGGVLGNLTAYRNGLIAQRAQIDGQIQGIDSALAALGAGTGAAAHARVRRSGGKGPRAGSLMDCIGRVLRGRSGGLSVTDITTAVLKAGYKSKNKTLGNSVSNALANMGNVAKVARGVYQLK